MLQNFFKLTLRHLWRNRSFTLLNVLGLSIGISAAWIMWQYASYEFGYDSGQQNSDRTYRVVSHFTFEGEESANAGIPKPMAEAAAQIAGVELAVPVFDQWASSILVGIPGGEGARFEHNKDIDGMVQTNDRYFQLVRYEWLAGNPEKALSQPNQVVLTQSRAAKYFPGLTPLEVLDKVLTYDDTLMMRVTGVVADLDYPSSFFGEEFRSFPVTKTEDHEWSGVSSNNQLFLLLAGNADVGHVAEQINRISEANYKEDEVVKWNNKRWHVLQPLSEIHFATKYGSNVRTANKPVLLVLMGISVFLLLLACINYVNLATAQIPQRAREIGIRKTLGSSRWAMMQHFLLETALVATCAVMLAAGFSYLFFQSFGTLLPPDVLRFVRLGPTVLFLTGLVAVVSLLAGLYPAWLIARFQPVQVLHGHLDTHSVSDRRVTLRKGLIVFQFTIAQLFISAAIIVGLQLHFLLHKDLGFNREAVILVQVPYKLRSKPENKDKHLALRDELRKLSGVAKVAMGSPLFDNSFSSSQYVYKDEKGGEFRNNLHFKVADTALIGLYQVPILAGRNLLPSDTAREFVLNETAVRAFGFASSEAAVGQFLQSGGGQKSPIVGVTADFHTAKFSQKIQPLAFENRKSGYFVFNIKLASRQPSEWQKTIGNIENLWNEFYPAGYFRYEFYDEKVAQIYAEETTLARIVNLATGVAVLISCLGLFGLAAFLAQRRTKEIGIRKVLGASVSNVVRLLASDFLRLVIIAFVIAMPTTYFFMQQWLQAYTYRIDMQWWMFALAGVIAVAVALLTVGFQSVKAALANPVESLRSE